MKIFATQDFNEALKSSALYICLGILLLLGVTILVLVLVGKKSSKKISISVDEASNILYDSLGGKDNIESYRLNGSRFSVQIKNSEIINKDKLNEIGIDNSIIMSNKVTLVLNEKGKAFIKEFLDKNSK